MDIFFKMQCLTARSESIKGLEVREKWFKGSQKRDIGNHLPKFLEYNKESLRFLGIEGRTEDNDERISIHFRSSKYIGAVPLVAPDTGLQIGDFVVTPRFVSGNDYATIADIIQKVKTELVIEQKDGMSLASGRILEPPFFLEAIKFIKALRELIKSNWIKFRREEILLEAPVGNINWDEYAKNEYRVERKLKFSCSKSTLSINHSEYSNIRFVYDLCRTEILSLSTPLNVRLNSLQDIELIDKSMTQIRPMRTNQVVIRASDSKVVKLVKQTANKILGNKFDSSLGWRVDFSELFERYVQFIFSLVSQQLGGVIRNNVKFSEIGRENIAWKLKYLEPDLIYDLGGEVIAIDAKYKSNLYNTDTIEGTLKDEHRADLHQILAYSSFSKEPIKTAFLCYPSYYPMKYKLEYLSPINSSLNRVYLLGVPISLEHASSVVEKILSILKSSLEKAS